FGPLASLLRLLILEANFIPNLEGEKKPPTPGLVLTECDHTQTVYGVCEDASRDRHVWPEPGVAVDQHSTGVKGGARRSCSMASTIAARAGLPLKYPGESSRAGGSTYPSLNVSRTSEKKSIAMIVSALGLSSGWNANMAF